MLSFFIFTGCHSSSDDQSDPAAENLAKGKDFLAQNKLKSDITTLENGIQYKIITKGNGKSPKSSDVSLIYHRGKHLDGSIFSDSYKSEKPEEILVKHSILGWKKVLTLMSIGSKWEVYFPTYMAFSNRGEKELIEPNETLIYEIELIGIKW
ncbi:MAG: FKBP-type peptidyl-prolyl cis-trans isomerase [Mariprofundaceae bacterium]